MLYPKEKLTSISIDNLFETFSNIFVKLKTEGMISIPQVDSTNSISSYMNYGINLIKEGPSLTELSLGLEYEFMLSTRCNNFNEQDLLQLLLIKYIIPLVFNDDYDTFLSLAKRYGSTSLNDHLVKVAVKYQLSEFLSSIYNEDLVQKMQAHNPNE